VINARAGSPLTAVLIAAGLGSLALTGFGASLGYLMRPASVSPRGPWGVAIVSALIFLGLAGWGATTSAEETAVADLVIVAENLAFSETDLSSPSGTLTVSLANDDLFWHTFTIDELGVNLAVPVGAKLSTTFGAPPGEYHFYCAIPGHPEAGMKGILVVGG
jgi:plastocyanin